MSFAPSGDLGVLTRQLLAATSALPGRAAGLDGWRRYHGALIAAVTRAIAIGQLDVPSRQHARMYVFLPFIEDHLGGTGEEAKCASALRELVATLEIQAHALEVPQVEQALANPTDLQRRVLEALAGAEEPLDRAAVLKQLPPATLGPRPRGRPEGAEGPTPEAVYQVLERLCAVGLVVRRDFANARGRRTAHYQLWGTGRELCKRAGVAGERQHAPGLVVRLPAAELLMLALDPATPGRALLVKQILSIRSLDTGLRFAFRTCIAEWASAPPGEIDAIGASVTAHIERLVREARQVGE